MSVGILLLVFTLVIIFVGFITIHLRPLSYAEVNILANKRRNRTIRSYFLFDKREFNPNKEFKQRMKANGSFYNINENLFGFPSTAAALLKYKKHEWILIAFEKDKNVNSIWVNKGSDRSSVSLCLSMEALAAIAKKSATSVLIFHNHPNINPNYYSYTKPSVNDIASAKQFAAILNNNGVNLMEFICERGKYYQYFFSPSNNFQPIQVFIEIINNENDKTRLSNFLLHFERIFSKDYFSNIRVAISDLSVGSSQEEIRLSISQVKPSENFLPKHRVSNGAFYLDLIMLDLKARRKSDIIMEMVGFFSSAGIVIDGQKFYERLLWRESLGSTGIGQGIATPYIYADLNVEEEIVTALAIIKEGVDFESLDGKPVQLIFMSAYKHHGKAENSSLHLKHLARISRFLRNEEHCQALLAANTKEEVFAYLKTNFS